MCSNVESYKPCFGDHLLVSINVNVSKTPNVISYRRDWRKYSKSNLLVMFDEVEWCTNIDNVQLFGIIQN